MAKIIHVTSQGSIATTWLYARRCLRCEQPTNMKKLRDYIKYAVFTIPVVIVGISYFGQVNIILSGIMVCLFLSIAQLIHLPEEMPGGSDNPDGTELLPKWIFFAAFLNYGVAVSIIVGVSSIWQLTNHSRLSLRSLGRYVYKERYEYFKT